MKASYERGALMQAPLALIGFVLGLLAWWQPGNWTWATGGVPMLANRPYTLLVIKSVNGRLMATEIASPETRTMIVPRGPLHPMRTGLGIAASIAFLSASLHS